VSANLLDETGNFVRRFVVINNYQRDAITLWNAHTYVFDAARATPYLHAHSPEPGSGKTTLLDVLELTARAAVVADGISEAALFRAAVELSGSDRRQSNRQSTAVVLLSHIRDVFVEDRMTCAAIVSLLNEDEQLPYGGWTDGKGMSTRELGKKLGPYGILAKPIRIDGVRVGNGYERDQFEDAWSRYLPRVPPQDRYTGPTQSQSQEPHEANRYSDPRYRLLRTAQTSMNKGMYRSYRFPEPGWGENGRIPLPGDEDFLDNVLAAFRAGHVTLGEALGREQLHEQLLVEAEPRP
jgi:Protein of unknown function (DUF3631)